MLLQKINDDLKQAMIDKNTETLSVLRMLVSAINNEEIALKKKVRNSVGLRMIRTSQPV